MADVILKAAELIGGDVAIVLFEHHLDVLQGILVAGHFVALLRLMGLGPVDFLLTLLPEDVADLGEDGRDDGIVEMMALNIKIGGLRRYTQPLDVLLRGQILFFGIGEFALQLVNPGMHLAPDLRDRTFRTLNAEATGIDHLAEIGNGKTGVIAVTINHDRPDEQGEYRLGELAEIGSEIKDAVVVERHRHTDIMQRRGIALEVLNRIDIGMEHIGALEDSAGGIGAALQQVVVVGIDTGNHILAQRLALEEVHQHRLLTPGQIDL